MILFKFMKEMRWQLSLLFFKLEELLYDIVLVSAIQQNESESCLVMSTSLRPHGLYSL